MAFEGAAISTSTSECVLVGAARSKLGRRCTLFEATLPVHEAVCVTPIAPEIRNPPRDRFATGLPSSVHDGPARQRTDQVLNMIRASVPHSPHSVSHTFIPARLSPIVVRSAVVVTNRLQTSVGASIARAGVEKLSSNKPLQLTPGTGRFPSKVPFFFSRGATERRRSTGRGLCLVAKNIVTKRAAKS